jgi:hypothetical protein
MENPLRHSPTLGRIIRQDGVETLGTSTQTLFERAASEGDHELAAGLLEYFWDEIWRIGDILFVWIEDILTFRMRRMGVETTHLSERVLDGIRTFDPSSGDRAKALACLKRTDSGAAIQSAELMRTRYAALHDGYVIWIQELLTSIARDHGEDAVFESIEYAYEHIWAPRYALWERLSALERLQLSVEGMRGHLSGMRRRGDVGIEEEHDRYVMVLDPCGSCGILRRGDPESRRQPYRPSGNRDPHPWTWGRIGVGWYSVHSPIVMEYLQMRDGRPPLRPLEDCDTERACRWYIYKDPASARPEHYQRMGFAAPDVSSPRSGRPLER